MCVCVFFLFSVPYGAVRSTVCMHTVFSDPRDVQYDVIFFLSLFCLLFCTVPYRVVYVYVAVSYLGVFHRTAVPPISLPVPSILHVAGCARLALLFGRILGAPARRSAELFTRVFVVVASLVLVVAGRLHVPGGMRA